MTASLAMMVWSVLAIYLAIGCLVALAGITVFMRRLEPYGAPVPVRVRLVLLPGLIALWPLVAARMAGRKPAEDSP